MLIIFETGDVNEPEGFSVARLNNIVRFPSQVVR